MTKPSNFDVFNNVYGLARSFIALSNLAAVLFTNPYFQFDRAAFSSAQRDYVFLPNFFSLFGYDNLYLAVALATIILLWVISGFLPQLSSIFHIWIIYSFFTGATFVEGGDQISQIITIFLLPICLFDKRLNHWSSTPYFAYKRPLFIEYFCFSCVVMIQFQASFLYFFAVAEKIHVEEWRTGTALYYWFNGNMFGANEQIKSIFNPLINSKIFSPLITWSVLLLEFVLACALFMSKRKKLLLLIPALLFHFSIILFHGLGTFFLAMVGLLILYLIPANKPISLNLASFKPPMIFKKGISVSLIAILFLVSCSKHANHELPVRNELTDSVYKITQEMYYWQNNLPNPDNFFTLYGMNMTPQEVLSNVRQYSPLNESNGLSGHVDKWSFSSPLVDWEEMVTGQIRDFGLGLRFNTDDDLRISWVQKNSNAQASNLRRGDRVRYLNDIECIRQNIVQLTSLMENSESLILKVERSGSKEPSNVTLLRADYQFDPIISEKVFNQGGRTVGYINIISFTNNLSTSLNHIREKYFVDSVDELIIDLRYNGGGLMMEMENLANLLAPPTATNKLMYETVHNDKISAFNLKTIFTGNSSSTNFKRISFITTNTTASASEMLINSLAPYIETKIIGSTTAGKLMGMYTIRFRDYILAPLSFLTVNSTGIKPHPGIGLPPDISCDDDLTNDFNQNELCIKAALTGNIKSTRRTTNTKSKQTSIEKVSYFNDAILERKK